MAVPQFHEVVHFDPGTGKFQMNTPWTPAYSGSNAVQRVRMNRAIADQVQRIRMDDTLVRMAVSGKSHYKDLIKGGKYHSPNSKNTDYNLARTQADVLNFQIQNQGKTVEQLAKDASNKGPGGWKGVLHDALNNPVGHLLTRGLDVVSRPAYAVAEAANSVAHAQRNESPEHPGWYELKGEGSNGMWENKKTGEVKFHPNWESTKSGASPMTALRGAVRGFEGKDKTSWSDVLNENDILHGKPAAILGFAGDVALDPSQYVSFGTSTVAEKGGKTLSEAERASLVDSAKAAAKEVVSKSGATGLGKVVAQHRAFNAALGEQYKIAGVSRKPVKEVVKDINSSYGPHSVERAMKDKVSTALKDPFWKIGTQRKIARTARKAYEAERTAMGEPIDTAIRNQVGKDAVKSAREEFSKKVGADVMDEIATRKALRENVQLDVKVAGHTVASSKTLGKAIRGTAEAAKGTRVGGVLARTFRTDAEIGDALHRIQRQHLNVGAAQFEEEAKQVKKVFTDLGLSKRERKLISRGIEQGSTKGFTDKMAQGYEAAQQFFRKAFDREVEAGALKQTDHVPNYLYHVYQEPNFKRGIGSWVKPTGGGAKKFRTLDEAIKGGARPMEDIADILVHRLAKSHRVASSHLMMRTIAARFGVDLAGKGVARTALKGLEKEGLLTEARTIGNGVGRFFGKGVYFDQDVAASLAKMGQTFSHDEMISKFGRLFDQVQARMKFLQTAPNPGFHIRNTMSDMFTNFLDGVTTPGPYKQAIRLLHGEGGLEKVKIVLRDGRVLDGHDIVQLYDGMGLRAGFFHSEANIIPGMGSKLLTGSSNVVRGVSEFREDTMRMAHFIDSLKKTPKMDSIEQMAELAAKKVRKYNFDYQDLTNIERRVFRRAVPFYTFMRKNVPLMLENYFTNPGKMLFPSKGQRALAGMLGQDNKDEPLPGLISSTPDWISAIPGSELQSMTPSQDSVFMQPDLPYNQLESLFGGFAQGHGIQGHLESGVKGTLKELLLQQSSPLFRVPAEYATQMDLSTGQQQPQSLLDAVINQVPIGRIAQPGLSKLAPNLFKPGRPDQPNYEVGGKKIDENLLNFLTGMGFRKVTPQRQKSELRRRQDILQVLLKEMKAQAVKDAQHKWDQQYGGQ